MTIPKRGARKNSVERVYFIGAGFSAGLSYPVGATLMSRLVEYLQGDDDAFGQQTEASNSVFDDEQGPARAAKILRVIERVLARFFGTKLSNIGQLDVAEFFTLAQALSERSWLRYGSGLRRSSPVRRGEPSEATLFADLAAVTRSFFYDLSWQEYPDDVDAVLRLVRPDRDAIIDFNWDEEIDIFFSSGPDEDVVYTLGAWQNPGETLVLKPHGSIGWYDLQKGIGNDNAYLIASEDPRILRHEKRLIAYLGNELPCDVDGETMHSPLDCPPVITAPTFAKRFDYVEQQQVWQDVLEVCRDAKDFIFLGYSLPRDDFLTRAAIRAAISRKGSADQIRCLMVDRSFDETKLVNLLGVFGGISRDRNFLECDFGRGDVELASVLRSKLRGARISRF